MGRMFRETGVNSIMFHHPSGILQLQILHPPGQRARVPRLIQLHRSLATQVACGPPLRSAVPFGQVISTVAFPSPLQQTRWQALISWVVKTPLLLLLRPLLPPLPILLKTWDRPTILGEFGARQLEEEVQILGLIHTTLMKTEVKQKEGTLIQVIIQFWMQIFETSFSGCCWSLLLLPCLPPASHAFITCSFLKSVLQYGSVRLQISLKKSGCGHKSQLQLKPVNLNNFTGFIFYHLPSLFRKQFEL